MAISHANQQVLEFYRDLPYNFHGSLDGAVAAIQKFNPLSYYPTITALLRPDMRVLDVGCGTGWATNSMNYFFRTNARGIDYNPKALDQARAVAQHLEIPPNFLQADLFTYIPEPPCELVVAIGVLHHTNNCHEAIRHLARSCVQPGGHLFVGLYHRHGRQPFLDHFTRLRAAGRTEEELLSEYRQLHPIAADDIFVRSWFRDQVLHPHETHHTLAEIVPVLEECGLDLVCSSINGFVPGADLESLFATEKTFGDVARARLKERVYYPGFFSVLARKREA